MAKENILKIGILLLIMVMITDPVSASGGSASNPELIFVPNYDADVWSGSFSAADWYTFSVNNGDKVYIDVQNSFAVNGGQMRLSGKKRPNTNFLSIVSSTSSQHNTYNVLNNPMPKIQIIPGNQFDYQFLVGRNW